MRRSVSAVFSKTASRMKALRLNPTLLAAPRTRSISVAGSSIRAWLVCGSAVVVIFRFAFFFAMGPSVDP
jgi:hypothetical protein